MRPGPLRSRNFRLLLACDVISTSGTAVATVALRPDRLAVSDWPGPPASQLGWDPLTVPDGAGSQPAHALLS